MTMLRHDAHRHSFSETHRRLSQQEASNAELVMPAWSISAILAVGFFIALMVVFFLEQRNTLRATRSRRSNDGKRNDTYALRSRDFRVTMLALLMVVVSLLVWSVIKVNFQMALSLLFVIPALASFYDVHAAKRLRRSQAANNTQDRMNRHETISLEATDRFQDLNSPLITVVLTGFAQICLLLFYVWALWDSGTPDFENPTIYIYYGVAILIQVAYIFSRDLPEQAKETREFWATVFFVYNDSHDWNLIRTSIPWMEKHGIYLRSTFSVIINTFGLVIILLGLPLQVATASDPLDFVLNVTAAYFIVEFDDLNDAVVIHFTPRKPLADRDEIKQDFELHYKNATRFIRASKVLSENSDKKIVLANAREALAEMKIQEDEYARILSETVSKVMSPTRALC